MRKPAALQPVVPEPGRPLYLAVQSAVRAAVDQGVFNPGQRLPSTTALSDQLGVSLVTVHRALQELVAMGVLKRGQGRGTFVHEEYAGRADVSTGLRFGLVFHRESSLADFYHGQILEGVRRGADELGVDLVLLRFGEDWRRECQGFLYVNPFPEQLERSPRFGAGAGPTGRAATRTPAVMVVGARTDRPGVSVVDTDNVDLVVQAVRHMASLGHRRIAYVGGEGGASNTIDRARGFAQGLREAGLDAYPGLTITSPGWRLDEEGRQSLAALLRSPSRPTAVFAAGYYFALDTYDAARTAELDVPKDLSVVGVDDPPSGAHLSPPLTTMQQPLAQVGRLAARGLFDQVGEDRPAVQTTLLKAELVVRGSTAPPSPIRARETGART